MQNIKIYTDMYIFITKALKKKDPNIKRQLNIMYTNLILFKNHKIFIKYVFCLIFLYFFKIVIYIYFDSFDKNNFSFYLFPTYLNL